MKKITFTTLLSMFMFFGYSQNPEYNYSLQQVSVSGVTETYEVIITASAAPPANHEVTDFQVNIAWDANAYTNAVLVNSGSAFGDFTTYTFPGIGIATADFVNTNLSPAIPSDKDILNIGYAAVITADHPAGNFEMVRFSIDRVETGAAAPQIISNSDVNITNAAISGFRNEFFTDVDGPFGSAPSTDRFNPALPTLSLRDINFAGLEFTAYPNPTQGEVRVYNPSDVDFDYEIVNIEGRVVLPKATLSARRENTLDFSPYNDGIYFINIKSGNREQKSIKIIRN